MFEVGFHFIPPALPASREVRWELPSVGCGFFRRRFGLHRSAHPSQQDSSVGESVMGSVGSSPGVGRTIGSSVEGAVVGVAGGFVGLPPPPGVVVAGAGICVLGASVTGAEVGAPETGADVRNLRGPGVPLGFFVIPG